MRWLKQSLWLGAWTFWAWLGVGLYRELPRDLIFVADVGGGYPRYHFGFIAKTNQVAVFEDVPSQEKILIYNGATGDPLRSYLSPPLSDLRAWPLHSLAYGRLFAVKDPTTKRSGLFILDLETGRWTSLTNRDCRGVAQHESRPWIAFKDNGGPNGTDRIVLYDYATGRALHEFTPALGEQYGDTPFFIPTRDRLVIPKKASGRLAADIWRLLDPIALQRTVPDADIGFHPQASTNGRVSFSRYKNGGGDVNVFDLNEGRLVYGDPPLRSLRNPSKSLWPCSISMSGRNVFGGESHSLVEIDSGRVLWKTGPCEFAGIEITSDAFPVREQWWRLVGLPFDPRLETYALRSLEDGALICRTRVEFMPSPKDYSRDGRYVALFHYGQIARRDPVVNWNLLALCQTLLALPILLLWLFLWWRRRRNRRPEYCPTYAP